MTCKGVIGLLSGRECFRTTGRFTARTLYPAVVIDETQPLHGHVSHMTPPEQDFAWRGERKRDENKESKHKERGRINKEKWDVM